MTGSNNQDNELCMEDIIARDFEVFEPSPDDSTHVLHWIIYFVKSMVLGMHGEDVDELVDARNE